MATTLYLVASSIVDFPSKQAERVAHSYVGKFNLKLHMSCPAV